MEDNKYDISAVWVARPDPNAYQVELNYGIEAVNSLVDPPMWKVKYCDGICLNRNGHWEPEPLSSARTEAFYLRCRWNNLDDAIAAALPLVSRLREQESETRQRREARPAPEVQA